MPGSRRGDKGKPLARHVTHAKCRSTHQPAHCAKARQVHRGWTKLVAAKTRSFLHQHPDQCLSQPSRSTREVLLQKLRWKSATGTLPQRHYRTRTSRDLSRANTAARRGARILWRRTPMATHSRLFVCLALTASSSCLSHLHRQKMNSDQRRGIYQQHLFTDDPDLGRSYHMHLHLNEHLKT